jgi:DNA polymerase III epsilon subunit-like protein
MTLARRVVFETRNHRLETLKRHFSLGDEPSHRGLNDVLTTVRLFQTVMKQRLETAGIAGFETIARFSRRTPVAHCHALMRNVQE